MFNWYIPDGVYERLPLLYVLLALVVSVLPSPLAFAKWLAAACLLTAAWITRKRRKSSRRIARAAPAPSGESVYVIEV